MAEGASGKLERPGTPGPFAFRAFVASQFLGAFNDNAFKMIVVLLGLAAVQDQDEVAKQGVTTLAMVVLTAPLMLVEVELESAETPSALSWSRGRGPDTSVEAGTPALARVTLEHRSPVSFVMPFVRWLGGLNR